MITYCVGTALNRLILAINCYVSTGDLIGMGVAIPEGPDRTVVLIPVNRTLALDEADFSCFRSRFEELAGQFGTELRFLDRHGPFDHWMFSIRNGHVDALARELRKRPGRLGWGTMKEQVEAFERWS